MLVIGNNCGSADFYSKLRCEFNNPFMWSLIFPDDFIRLIEKYDALDFSNVDFIRLTKKISNENGYQYEDCRKICGLKIDNTFSVYFTHYVYDATKKLPTKKGPDILYYKNFEYMYDKYVHRTNMLLKTKQKPCFLIICLKRHGWTKEKIEKLKNIHSKYKIMVITKFAVKTNNENVRIIIDKDLDNKITSPLQCVSKHFEEIKTFCL